MADEMSRRHRLRPAGRGRGCGRSCGRASGGEKCSSMSSKARNALSESASFISMSARHAQLSLKLEMGGIFPPCWRLRETVKILPWRNETRPRGARLNCQGTRPRRSPRRRWSPRGREESPSFLMTTTTVKPDPEFTAHLHGLKSFGAARASVGRRRPAWRGVPKYSFSRLNKGESGGFFFGLGEKRSRSDEHSPL